MISLRWRDLLTFADGITLLNGACGVLSIFLSLKKEFFFASLLMLAAVLFDALDGKVARYFALQGKLGKDLDSLCDAISFGIAPAVFGFSNGLDSIPQVSLLVIFCLGGILRLARFNVLSLGYFVGMPITVNGVLIPLAFFLGIFASPWAVLLYVVSFFLMISSFHISKL